MRCVWQGQLAKRWGLRGEVNEEFARLSEGQCPGTGEPVVRRQQAREYVNERGETVRTMEHRAGWDATFYLGVRRNVARFVSCFISRVWPSRNMEIRPFRRLE